MSKKRLFRQILALITVLLLTLSTVSTAFAAETSTTVNPKTVYAQINGVTVAIDFQQLWDAYANDNTAYQTTWKSAKILGIVMPDGTTLAWDAFWDALAANEVQTVVDYANKAGHVAYTVPTQCAVVDANGVVGTVGQNPNVPVTLAVSSAAAAGTKKIAVTFNQPVADTSATTFTVKKGLVPYTVTATWSADKTVATLTYLYDFIAGDYTVAVSGIEGTKTVTFKAETVTKIVLTDAYLPLKDGVVIGYKVYNQYNEEMKTVAASALNFAAFNLTKGTALTVINPATTPALNLATASAAKDNSVIITITHPTTGVSATATLAVKDAAAAQSMAFGTVAPLTGKTRISVSQTGFVLPYTFTDQYGTAFTFAQRAADGVDDNTTTINGVVFTTSNPAIVDPDTFAVDANGVLTFNTGATAGTVILGAMVPSTGATAVATVKVEATSGLKTFNMSAPATLVVQEEDLVIPYVATDSFDAPIAQADFTYTLGTGANQVNIISSDSSIVNVATDLAFNYKHELVLTPTGTGTVTLYAYVGGVLQGSIALDVKALAVPTKVVGLTSVPVLFQNGASKTLTAANVNVIDQYNRAIDLGSYGLPLATPDVYTVKVTAKDTVADKVTIATPDITSVSTATTIAGAAVGTTGSEELVFTLQKNGADVANSAYNVVANTIAAADVKSYSITAQATIYDGAYATVGAAGTQAKKVTLLGKDASGNDVTVPQTLITALTSSDPTVIGTDFASLKVFGAGKGSATVTAWNGATKLGEVVVTASDATPVAKTAVFDAATYTENGGSLDLKTCLTVKDQYGTVMNISGVGTWTSSDTAKVTVSDGVLTKVAAGSATVSYVTVNGIAVTAEIVVQ